MLLKDGKGSPFPWTERLAERHDMKEVLMTADEIKSGVVPKVKEQKPPLEKFLPDETVAARRANMAKARETVEQNRTLRDAQKAEEGNEVIIPEDVEIPSEITYPVPDVEVKKKLNVKRTAVKGKGKVSRPVKP